MYPQVDIDEGSPSIEIVFTVGYWRKANAVHGWFVTNVQGGEDECKPHYVSSEDLIKLRDDCKLEMLVSAGSPSGAGVVEPTSGFFFGSNERDEWYYDNLKHTIEIVDKCLELDKDGHRWSFEYQSSW
jgi:uncharacterized protein YneR